jgi:putative membrane protein
VQAEDSTAEAPANPVKTLAEGNLSATRELNGRDETVYVIVDATGAKKSTFIGSTLYTGEDTLPFNVKVNYTLDGAEISPEALAGKSGHVKISYKYEPVAMSNYEYVPFLAVTSMTLDTAKFSNVKLVNAKIINAENMMIVGYGVPGLNENLGTGMLPDGFTIEADVQGFALADAYTVIMNEPLADIDTSRLTTVDNLVAAVNQLADGAEQLLAGAGSLADGAHALVAGAQTLRDGGYSLVDGAAALAAGVNSASEGAGTLRDGLAKLAENNEKLNAGASQIFDSILATASEELKEKFSPLSFNIPDLTQENYAVVIDGVISQVKAMLPAPMSEAIEQQLMETKMKLGSVDEFTKGLAAYTEGVTAAAGGSAELAAGLDTINTKMPVLINGVSSLANGASQLYNGAVELANGADTLRDGINTFKTTGTDQLRNVANSALAGLMDNIRRSVTAAGSYHDFGHTNAKSVKFIVKTEKI